MDDKQINSDFIDVESTDIHGYQGEQWNTVNGNIKPPKKERKTFKLLGIISGVVMLSMISGLIGSSVMYYVLIKNSDKNGIYTSKSNASYVSQSFTQNEDGTMSAADAFKKVSPAVVTVSTKALEDVNYGIFSQQQEVEGIGSGFIINNDGYILTNYHVIQGATDVKVTLSTDEEVPATVVNYDQNKDVAMLKLSDPSKVPAVVSLGDSDAMYPGAEVIAIGTPLSKNFAHTLTKGVISGSDRKVATNTGNSVKLLQTDTAINPGNSGGPLVNSNGEVIGINSMKMGSDQGGTSVEGIGFAIPINEVKNIIDTLSKPILNLGIKVREVDEKTAKQYDLKEGIYVVSVDEYSPAEKAGMRTGDVIVKCDGKDTKTFEDLKSVKDSKNSGDTMKVEVIRNDKKVDLDVTLTEGN